METPSKEEIVNWFYYDGDWNRERCESLRRELEPVEILYACYETGDYCGDWIVVFAKDGKVFADTGSHCSCNGPEWSPQEESIESLIERYKERDWSHYAKTVVASLEAYRSRTP